MDKAINDNPCVCCGGYAVEGSWLCWICQQSTSNTQTTKDYFIEKFYQKALDKSNEV